MRDLRELNHWRDWQGEARVYGKGSDADLAVAGAFNVPAKGTRKGLRVIASTGGGWDHVSISLPMRCPTWEEMDAIKRLFFLPGEVAMQLHVGAGDHISNHRYCLHIWRPNDGQEIPLPPAHFVGEPDLGELPLAAHRRGIRGR